MEKNPISHSRPLKIRPFTIEKKKQATEWESDLSKDTQLVGGY